MNDNVKVLRLVDGSYAIGKIGEVEVTDVIAVSIGQAEDGGFKISFMPFMFPFNQSMSGMSIGINKVLANVIPTEELIKEYSSAISAITGLVMASSIPKNIGQVSKPTLKAVK